jgi:hypothetical protein
MTTGYGHTSSNGSAFAWCATTAVPCRDESSGHLRSLSATGTAKTTNAGLSSLNACGPMHTTSSDQGRGERE